MLFKKIVSLNFLILFFGLNLLFAQGRKIFIFSLHLKWDEKNNICTIEVKQSEDRYDQPQIRKYVLNFSKSIMESNGRLEPFSKDESEIMKKLFKVLIQYGENVIKETTGERVKIREFEWEGDSIIKFKDSNGKIYDIDFIRSEIVSSKNRNYNSFGGIIVREILLMIRSYSIESIIWWYKKSNRLLPSQVAFF